MRFLNNQVRPGNKKLSTLMIYATDLCDSACKHCLIWAKRPVNFLPKEKIIEVMQSSCITKSTSIGLEGGEFLLHPHALDILQWFAEHHQRFDLLSNCLQPDQLIDAVKRYPPRHLYISLDGDAETYLHMRGKPGYDSVIKVIEELHDRLPVSVMFTLSPYNDFTDLAHVAGVCKRYGIDMRVGIYNDIAFFDTIDKAHDTAIGAQKGTPPLVFKDVRNRDHSGQKQPAPSPLGLSGHDFIQQIPESVKDFAENYDFMVLYNEWKKGGLKMKCYSILDSLVILPNGDVPICQNLDLKIGNIFQASLDEIFNGPETRALHKEYVHNCNQCWLNFHRKYDVILYRSFEKYFGRSVTKKVFGYYQWEESATKTYAELMNPSAK
ncbi:radical SAM protein [Flavihumibacter sp. CACIAM 22H1]|uniref:radical SAM protein n=1 Tax=Flavihumibacter sp. CACIAM 22H1 TaxID=1812911 RepID=UPI0025BBE2C1|nr:radical SAM protein [Flavihumibacter sp. CACIAM 22H1]